MTFRGSAVQPLQWPLRSLVASGRFREALALFCELSDRPDYTFDHDELLVVGQAAARVGEFELATRLAETAREGFETSGDVLGLLETTNLLGGLAFERGWIDEAEDRFQEVLLRAEECGRAILVARSANNLASIAHLRGRPSEAGPLYEKSLRAFEQLGDLRGIAETSHNIALACRLKGALGDASSHCARALAAAERLGEPGLLSLALLGHSELLIEQEALDEANSVIDRAEMLAWTGGNEPHRLEADRLRAVVSLRRGQAMCAYERAEAVRIRAAELGCALIAAQAAAVAALALQATSEQGRASLARDWAEAALKALGAVAVLERFKQEWVRGSAAVPRGSGAVDLPLEYD